MNAIDNENPTTFKQFSKIGHSNGQAETLILFGTIRRQKI